MNALRKDDGVELVEVAFVLLILMMLLFGITGFAHAFYSYHFLSNEAREATRWASVNGSACATDGSCFAPATEDDIQALVLSHTPPRINTDLIKVSVTWPGSAGICTVKNAPGCPVRVQVSYDFNFIFPLIRLAALPMSSTSEMTIVH